MGSIVNESNEYKYRMLNIKVFLFFFIIDSAFEFLISNKLHKLYTYIV